MVWRVAVGGDNCLHELDPVTLTQTGNTVCGSPWTNTSQRGMAYDAINNAYFIGGWNEFIVYHVDSDGVVIDSANVGLSISGMAYDASNGHLLVMSNTDGVDITVLDALNNYAVVGSYNVVDGGAGVRRLRAGRHRVRLHRQPLGRQPDHPGRLQRRDRRERRLRRRHPLALSGSD
jgi:hypothetical protein